MALAKVKTEGGHKAGRTGRKGTHRDERKQAARKRRRRADRCACGLPLGPHSIMGVYAW